MTTKNKSLLTFLLVLVVLALLALFLPDNADAQTSPVFVANSPGTGKFLTIHPDSTDATTSAGLSMLDVVAGSSGVTFSVWTLDSSDTWVRWIPRWGLAASDTVITLGAAEREFYRFPPHRQAKAVVVSAGDATFKGE